MKKLSPDDEALWRVLTQEITPLLKKTRPFYGGDRYGSRRLQTQIDFRRRIRQETHHLPLPAMGESNSHGHPSSKQIKTFKKIQFEGKIDLHGFTRDEAWSHLQQFLSWAQSQGYTWLLVITGKGPKGSVERGILRQEVPLWLNHHPQVGAFCPAKSEHGGHGALYVRIKKLKLF